MSSLENIYFISIPEKLSPYFEDLEISPTLLLPIENHLNEIEDLIKNLSLEMIVAGMLKVMVIDPSHKDIPSYRTIIAKVKPNLAEELTHAAYAKINLKNYDVAEEIFNSLLAFDPDDSVTQLNLALLYDDKAILYRESNNETQLEIYTQKAKVLYDSIMGGEDPLIQAYYYAALFYARNFEAEKAKLLLTYFIEHSDKQDKIESAKKILDIINEEEQDHSLFSKAYDEVINDNETEGINLIEQFLNEFPNVWNGWFLKGWAYRRIQQFSEAISAFEKALELNKLNTDTFNELAICHMELKEYDKAEIYLDQALLLSPDNVKLLSNYAIFNLKNKNIKKAKEIFDKILEIDPNDELANKFLNF